MQVVPTFFLVRTTARIVIVMMKSAETHVTGTTAKTNVSLAGVNKSMAGVKHSLLATLHNSNEKLSFT